MPPKTTAPGDPATLDHESDAASPGRPYGGQSPDACAVERRRRILDAALQCYGTAGYPATTIAELCRTASVACGVKFYEEFTGKEELLYVLSTEIMTEAVTLQLDAGAARPPHAARPGAAGCARLLPLAARRPAPGPDRADRGRWRVPRG